MGCSLTMKAKGLVLVSLVAMISILGAGADAGTVQPSKIVRQVPAMYVFGDSGLDIGNNNFLPGNAKVNMAWYGVDFSNKPRATGRFSNGYNIADFVAMTLGLKESPPAYLSLEPHPISLVLSATSTGVNYASGGSGILDMTSQGSSSIPLSHQVRHFQSTKAAMVAKVGSRAVSDLLARSFFLFLVGSNDLYAHSSLTPSDAAALALYTSLISNYKAAITGLYETGARKFGIINVGQLGCAPFMRNEMGACNDGLNQLAAGFDDELRSLLAGLASSLPGVTYSLADQFGFAHDIFANPQAYGYANIDSACCGSGRLGAQSWCLPSSTLCGNREVRDQFFFWDWVHPSQRFGNLSAATYYDGPAKFTLPINFKQLAIQEVREHPQRVLRERVAGCGSERLPAQLQALRQPRPLLLVGPVSLFPTVRKAQRRCLLRRSGPVHVPHQLQAAGHTRVVS